MSLDEIREKVVPILRKYGVKRASILGSTARGEDREGSDIDILVEVRRTHEPLRLRRPKARA